MSTTVGQQIVQALQRRRPPAALVAEVAATLRPPPDTGQLEDALRDLGRQGKVLIRDHAPPDVHLTSADLRVVAWVTAEGDNSAIDAAEDVWNGWLRAFLSSHRCQ